MIDHHKTTIRDIASEARVSGRGVAFATNTLTLAGIKSILHRGARIQDQIHIVGFDDSDAFALFYPPISHVRQPIEQISSRSIRVFKELIDKREPVRDR